MRTTYALDANTISYFLRDEGNIEMNFQREIIEGSNPYVIPFIVAYEIKRWLYDRPTKQMRIFAKAFDTFFSHVEKDAEMDVNAWNKAVEIYVELKQRGQLIGDADILIAAYCIVNNCTLVTRNKRDFRRIENLRIVNWFD